MAGHTIVFFASDNGPWSDAPPRMFRVPKKMPPGYWELRGPNKPGHTGSSGPLRGAKHTTYEGGTRVPAMIRWPGHIKSGQVTNALVANLDIFRTFLEVGGGKLPNYRIDGYNMIPFFTGKTDQSPRKEYAYLLHGYIQGLRTSVWKIREVDGDIQLFNMQSDPGEHYNRAGTEPEVVNQLHARMEKIAREIDAKLSNE